MLNAVFVADPALANKLYEFTVYILGCTATLFPIENEFGPYAVVKRDGYLGARKDFLCVATGLPLVIEFWRFFNSKSRVPLTVPPLR